MLIATTRFGHLEMVEVEDDALLDMPKGLIGFEEHTRFAVLQGEDLSPFYVLQSLADPWLAFVAVDARLLRPGYRLELSRTDAEALRLGDAQALPLAIITLGDEPGAATANLLAPVVVNPQLRLARQVVQVETPYKVAEPIAAAMVG